KGHAGVRDDFVRWQVLMRAAPPEFKDKIFDFDDMELRFDFVRDALKWAAGGEEARPLESYYEGYNKVPRLRRTLRAIEAFSPAFDAAALDDFLHLSAPPEKPAQEKPALSEVEGPAEAQTQEPDLQPATFDLKPEDLEPADETITTRGLGPKGQQPSREGARFFAGMEFMPIPAGKFIMGSKDDDKFAADDEKPQHTLDLPYDYFMARFPVTNAEYGVYLKAAGGEHPVSDWQKKKDHPVTRVSWQNAQKFIAWLNETQKADLPSGYLYRLPSEAEWEKAARGAYGNLYPWGDDWDPKRCNSSEIKIGGTTPVTQFSPLGDSPYGVADMSGNVWEWTRSLWDKYPYPAEIKAQLKREDENASGARAVRGGSWGNPRNVARCACRGRSNPDDFDFDLGFRVVLSPG
ncbi:MAG: formylglycine-generating enzyme family protein, partial [Chloroflexota bacterium]